MKQFLIYIISFIFIMPQPSVHKDIIVYDSNINSHLEQSHEDFHHKNDTEHDKKTKHHHHCTVELSVLTIVLPIRTVAKVNSFDIQDIKIHYHNPFHTTSFVGTIFHPPRA